MAPILLLHGALGNAQSLYPLRDAMRSLDVHVLEFSGHGASLWPEEGFSIETFEADVLRYLDAHNFPAAHLFGYSMGGFVALRLAGRAPERVLSVSTLATKFLWTEDVCTWEAAQLQPEILEEKLPKFVAALAAVHPQAGWKKLVMHTQVLLQGMSGYRFSDEAFSALKQPVQLMLGDRDKMVSLDETVAAYKALPNAALAVLPHTPHLLEKASVALLATLIENHIRKVQ